ncbi:MAG: dTDP-4-dehydrorhamnose reductase [Acidobacteriota bacterium]
MSRTPGSKEVAGLRPVVLGSDGRAGRVISRLLSDAIPQTVAATRTELDILDYFNLRWECERLQANLLVNAAGWADVDGCEADPGRAFRVNAEGAGHVARVGQAVGARVVHLSTDYVFAGTKGEPYVETDSPAPLSVYGKSKLAGERAVREAQPEALVVRTAWLFGGTGARPDFIEKILKAAAASPRIPVVRDQVGSPTGVQDLARGLLKLILVGATGTVHLVCRGGTDRATFARQILQGAGRGDVRVIPVSSGAVPGGAPRPADTRLDTGRFQAITGSPPRTWQEALRESWPPREWTG